MNMLASVYGVVATLTIVCMAAGQEKNDNPFRGAKVGDYVAYRATTSIMGKDTESTVKWSVSAKTKTEVTLKTAMIVSGEKQQEQSFKVDLAKAFDPTMPLTEGRKKFKLEKRGEGKENIKLGDKTYACVWLSGKIIEDVDGKKMETDFKVWHSKSVPLVGIVKSEIKSKQFSYRMELAGFGHVK